MIQQMLGLPEQIVGFDLKGEITKEDYDTVVFPAVQKYSEKYGTINMLMVLNTEVKNFKVGAWMDDALLGLKHLTKWNRVAMISDENMVKTATIVMDKVIPGEYKAFPHLQRSAAIEWLLEKNETEN